LTVASGASLFADHLVFRRQRPATRVS
jgi:hypothetical protein